MVGGRQEFVGGYRGARRGLQHSTLSQNLKKNILMGICNVQSVLLQFEAGLCSVGLQEFVGGYQGARRG